MKQIFRNISLTLLYLTPIGYLLNLLHLYSGERTPDVYVDLPRDKPIKVVVKENSSIGDRIHWFFNGTVLTVQAFWVTHNSLGGDIGLTYAWIASIFGVVNVISAFIPNFRWVSSIAGVKISLIWILLIATLIFTVIYSTIDL